MTENRIYMVKCGRKWERIVRKNESKVEINLQM
jgi:hypothetical protein